MDSERVILGIDPGTQLLGFGIIRSAGKKAEYVDMGVLDIRREKADIPDRTARQCFAQYQNKTILRTWKSVLIS